MSSLEKGTRVALHASTDHWMRGDRYGEIVGRGLPRSYVDRETKEIVIARPYLVKLDKSGKTVRLHSEALFPLEAQS